MSIHVLSANANKGCGHEVIEVGQGVNLVNEHMNNKYKDSVDHSRTSAQVTRLCFQVKADCVKFVLDLFFRKSFFSNSNRVSRSRKNWDETSKRGCATAASSWERNLVFTAFFVVTSFGPPTSLYFHSKTVTLVASFLASRRSLTSALP